MMERLTRRCGTEVYMICGDSCYIGGDCNWCNTHDILLERLAAYEDTGLTPEEIKKIVTSGAKFCEAYNEADAAFSFKHIKELLNAEADGRLIVLPCKVGDTVWSGEPFVDKHIREGSIVQINIDAFGFCGFWASFHPSAIAAEFISEDIGKTVFFSREEAEAALRRADNG